MKGGCRRGIIMAKMADSSRCCKHWGHEDVSCRAMLQLFAQGAILLLSEHKENLCGRQKEIEVTSGSIKTVLAQEKLDIH
jgi:hypothetical protein